jgi:hypothetical protein
MSHLESIDHRRHAFSEQIKTDQGWVVVGKERTSHYMLNANSVKGKRSIQLATFVKAHWD